MAALYLDSNVIISLMEDGPVRKAALVARLTELAGPDGRCVVSDLVRLECRVKPIADGDPALLRDYDDYFSSPDVTVTGIAVSAYDRATEVRARHRYETPDALHLAAAIEAGCDLFVTADSRLARFPDIRVVLVGSD